MALDIDLFLSHNWGRDAFDRDNHGRVSLISRALKNLGYQTWFDEENMSGSIVQQMSHGIEQAKGFIVFLTKRYHDKVTGTNFSDNCQLEFNYACRKKTRSKMIPVVMEKCMLDTRKWRGLIGMYLGGEMYLDMSGDLEDKTYLSQKMRLLQKELQHKGIEPMRGIIRFYLNIRRYSF